MVSQARSLPERSSARAGSWYERTILVTPALSVMVDRMEKLRLDMDQASSERSSITVGREGTRCGEGAAVAEPGREKDVIVTVTCVPNVDDWPWPREKKGISLVANKLFTFASSLTAAVFNLNCRVSACVHSHGHSSMWKLEKKLKIQLKRLSSVQRFPQLPADLCFRNTAPSSTRRPCVLP